MLNPEIITILEDAAQTGWVFEPDAKRLLAVAGLTVPRFKRVMDINAALEWTRTIGYPVAAKVVSPAALHKSDVGGVAVGIDNDDTLRAVFERFSRIEDFCGVVVENMVSGVELIVGAKIDHQFGPVVLLGFGGTGVEIYRDTALRMAPLSPRDVSSMINCLKARPLLEGYRGTDPVHMRKLTQTLLTFSELIMALEGRFESIDLNPVICSASSCVIADARIVLPHPG